jgi:glycosyltransferase involved in cell wall biosynthesis
MTQGLQSTITFIIPIQNKQDFLIQQINVIFKLSEGYHGFCEIIIAANGAEDTTLKIAWLAMKLNKAAHPYVRTRTIRYASQGDINELIDTAIDQALGQKIIIVTDDPERIKTEKMNGLMNRDIWITQYTLDANALEEIQSHMALT